MRPTCVNNVLYLRGQCALHLREHLREQCALPA